MIGCEKYGKTCSKAERMAFLNQSKYKTTIGQCLSVAEIQAFLKATISVARMVIFPFSCVLFIWFYKNCMSQVVYA